MNKDKNIETISILGCGWLGLSLGIQLLEEGYRVKGSTTSPGKLPKLEAAGIEAFLLEVEDTVTGDRKSAFFQSDLLVLNIPPGRRRPDVETAHPKQVRMVYQEARSSGIGRMIFISSTGVYGNTNRLVTEQDFPLPETRSGRALLTIEQFFHHQSEIDVSILRPAGLVGGDRKAGRFLAGKKEVANGRAPVNLVHRNDCIAVILEVIRQGKWGEVYNICADEHPTREDFYTAQARKQGFEPPTFQPDGAPSFKVISNEKIKRELGFEFKHPDPMQF